MKSTVSLSKKFPACLLESYQSIGGRNILIIVSIDQLNKLNFSMLKIYLLALTEICKISCFLDLRYFTIQSNKSRNTLK